MSPKVRRYVITASALVVVIVTAAVLVRRATPKEIVTGPPKVATMTSSAPPPPPEAPAPAAGPAELAILAPIVAGSTSKGWKVQEIRAVKDGVLRVVFTEENGKGRVDLDVALNDDDGVVPPATAGGYAVYYSTKRTMSDEGDRLAKLVAKTIEKHLDAPVPPGLGKFKARPKEAEPL